MSAPRVLAVTSDGAASSVVTPVLAALEGAGLAVRALDVGRAGSREEGAVGRLVRAVAGELAERRLERDLDTNPVDVVLAFDPTTVSALTSIRDQSGNPAPVIAVLPELTPATGWAGTSADRYLVVDDEAAVALADRGIEGHKIMPVGAVAPFAFVAAAAESRSALRARFKLPGDRPVVLVHVEGMGYELAQQIALQLSLLGSPATYLFDAGSDTEAATALRRQVPTLELKAKLFGKTAEAPRYWRVADVIVARPTLAAIAKALLLGCQFVALMDEAGDGDRLASAVVRRKLGGIAASPLLLSSTLETVFGAQERPLEGIDGAGNIADIAFIVGADREGVMAEGHEEGRARTRERVDRAAAFVDSQARAAEAPGELEDLSGDDGGAFVSAVDEGELAELRAAIKSRMEQVQRVLADARKRADDAEARATRARKRGEEDAAEQADKSADAERARMHQALREMAELQSELDTVKKAESAPRGERPPVREAAPRRGGGTSTRNPAPSVDDLLSQLKRDASSAGPTPPPPTSAKRDGKATRGADSRSSVDDELAALKRKMQNQKRRK